MNEAILPVPKKLAPPVPTVSAWEVGGIVALTAWLYWQILGRLAAQWWHDPNYSHGFLVPAFVLFLIWRIRSELAKVPRKPSWAGLAVISGALIMLVAGVLAAELFLSRSSLVFLVAGYWIFFQGWARFRAIWLPWLMLFLMIPIPAIILNQITFPLQILASKLASFLLAATGIPVLREGNILKLPVMSLEVAEACSGIRSLLSLGTLAIVFGYFMESSVVVRALLAIASIPIAVTANALRIVGTGLLVRFWDPEKAEGFFHIFSGWVIFLLSFGMLLAFHWLIGKLRRPALEVRK